MSPANVILFGETGAGKSSLINLMCGDNRADISNAAIGCTLEAQPHEYTDSHGINFRFWDTAGLDEGDGGRVPKVDAIIRLYRLMVNLNEGISLLVFVMRAPRLKEASVHNWRLFHQIICRSEVPIVVAVTGLENEQSRANWWNGNESSFHSYGIFPAGYAGVVGTRGKKKRDGTFKLDEEYQESREDMLCLVRSHLRAWGPWRPSRVEWFRHVTEVSFQDQGWCRSPKRVEEVRKVACEGIQMLRDQCKMSEAEAHDLGQRLSQT